MSIRISTPSEYAKLLDNYDTWLFDCDGVLWRGDHLIEGAAQVLDMLRRRSMSSDLDSFWLFQSTLIQKDKRVVFVTNNATKSRKSYKSKFDQLGVQAHVVSGTLPYRFGLSFI